MAREITSYKLKDVARSDVLAFLAGMEKLHPDFVYPTVLPFRTIALASGAASQTDEEQVPANFDFYCDGVAASAEALIADTRDIARFIYVNFRGEGLNRDLFSTPISLGYFQSSLGGTSGGGGSPYMPVPAFQATAGRQFRVPYVFAAGQLIRCTFTCDVTLGATAHVVEAWLSGYMVRTDLEITEKSAAPVEFSFSQQGVKVLDAVLKALRG